MPTEPTDPLLCEPLNYARPEAAQPSTFKYFAAILFALGAIPLGILIAIGGILMLRYASALVDNTTDQETGLREGVQMLIASIILIVPGLYYGRLGIRGMKSSSASAVG